jgi:hypothetical protein
VGVPSPLPASPPPCSHMEVQPGRGGGCLPLLCPSLARVGARAGDGGEVVVPGGAA